MKGIHRIIIQNKRVRYDFELRRNLTVLRGDSATGKTTLIEMIREFTNNGADSSITLTCDKTCYVLEGATWKGQLSVIADSIVFLDEGNPFVFTDEFAAAIRDTDNYYVIVSRESLPSLPYSVTEIYGIRSSGYYAGLKQHYNEFYRIYGEMLPGQSIHHDVVVTEDSNAGYQFFDGICDKSGIRCIPAGGKTKVLNTARQEEDGKAVLIIADGAAFGSEMDRVVKFMENHNNVRLYVPESFEYLILLANPMKDPEIHIVLESVPDHIESRDFFSWEQFFTRLLTDRTRGTYLQYSKNKINPAYLKGTVKEGILANMERINLDVSEVTKETD